MKKIKVPDKIKTSFLAKNPEVENIRLAGDLFVTLSMLNDGDIMIGTEGEPQLIAENDEGEEWTLPINSTLVHLVCTPCRNEPSLRICREFTINWLTYDEAAGELIVSLTYQ